MGVYFLYRNLDKKEWIDLSKIGEGGIKLNAACGIAEGPAVLAHALRRRWRGDRVEVLSDAGDEYAMEETEDNWRDVTAELYGEWKQLWPPR